MSYEPSNKPVFTLPEYGRKRSFSIALYTILSGLGVIAVLPLSQILSGNPLDKTMVRSVDLALPPPPPPPPEQEPPPPPEEEQQVDDVQQEPQNLSLSQLESALNPGMGDAIGSAFSLDAAAMASNIQQEIKAFSLKDLDRQPRPLRFGEPQWPQDVVLKGQPIHVRAEVIIDEQGHASVSRIIESSDPAVNQAVRIAVSKWQFEPPTKDGQPVKARYILPIDKTFD